MGFGLSLDGVLDLLKDGRPHHVTEVQGKLKTTRAQMIMVINFLEKYEILEITATGKMCRLRPGILKFLKEIKAAEDSLEKEKKFKDFNEWQRQIAQGCEHMTEPPFIGIPAPLPKCELTGEGCRFDTCPRREKEKDIKQ